MEEMVNLQIDGKQVKARPGATVLEAAREAGIKIPTLCVHEKLAPYGVRVNAIAPGPVETEMVKDFSEEAMQILVEQAPLKRIADTDDIANGALFLLSDAARHITGEILDINGGLLMD